MTPLQIKKQAYEFNYIYYSKCIILQYFSCGLICFHGLKWENNMFSYEL